MTTASRPSPARACHSAGPPRIRAGGVEIVLISTRAQAMGIDLFSNHGIDPRARRLLVVKSNQHFHASFATIASRILYGDGDGAQPRDVRRLPYRRVSRPIWPLDADAKPGFVLCIAVGECGRWRDPSSGTAGIRPVPGPAGIEETDARMLSYLAHRLASTFLVMAVVGVFVFLLLHLSPGDPAAIIAGDNATPRADRRASASARPRRSAAGAVRALGLAGVLQGDLGISIFSHVPVSELDRPAPRADAVAGAATTLLVAVTLAVSFGVLAAWKAGRWIDRVVMVFSVLGFSVPVFVVGYMLIYVFAIKLRWLPVQGYAPLADGFGPWIAHLDPAVDRARARLCGADRAHHAHRHARRAGGGLHPHRARQGRRDAADAAEARAEERRRADRDGDRHRRRAADRRRRHHRDGVQHPRRRPPRRRCDLASATTRSSRA